MVNKLQRTANNGLSDFPGQAGIATVSRGHDSDARLKERTLAVAYFSEQIPHED